MYTRFRDRTPTPATRPGPTLTDPTLTLSIPAREPQAEVRSAAEENGTAPSSQPVLCGVDESAEAQVAMQVAARLAGRLGLDLVLVHVGDSPMREQQIRRELSGWAADAGVSGAQLVAFGAPAATLAETAQELDAAFIVVGSRSRGRLAAALRGSVSADVLKRADRPVVVAPGALAVAGA